MAGKLTDEIILRCFNCKRDVAVTAIASVLYADENVICVDADYQCDECDAVIPSVGHRILVGWVEET